MAASTNADCAVLASLQGPPAGSVATSWKGVESPFAESGFEGTISEQSGLGGASEDESDDEDEPELDEDEPELDEDEPEDEDEPDPE